MLCEIYKGTKKAEMYLYVPLEKGLKDVPETLLQSFGELELVMKLEPSESRKLARVDVVTVIEDLQQKGFIYRCHPQPGMCLRLFQRRRNSFTMSEFWESKKLHEMTTSEWESLCDGCGKCCLVKLEDYDTAEIYHTNLACKLLDIEACRCTDYGNRQKHVDDCVKLNPQNLKSIQWLPDTCSYKLFRAGEIPARLALFDYW